MFAARCGAPATGGWPALVRESRPSQMGPTLPPAPFLLCRPARSADPIRFRPAPQRRLPRPFRSCPSAHRRRWTLRRRGRRCPARCGRRRPPCPPVPPWAGFAWSRQAGAGGWTRPALQPCSIPSPAARRFRDRWQSRAIRFCRPPPLLADGPATRSQPDGPFLPSGRPVSMHRQSLHPGLSGQGRASLPRPQMAECPFPVVRRYRFEHRHNP